MTRTGQWLRDSSGLSDGAIRSHLRIRHALWEEYGDRLAWVESFSPYVDAHVMREPEWRKGQRQTDIFGCEWQYPLEDLAGQVKTHPLSDWRALADYTPPDPDDWTDWRQVEKDFAEAHARGEPASGDVEHGFIFLRLTYLRGFEQFMIDVVEHPPELDRLIEIVEGYWTEVVQRYIDAGADLIAFADDLGLQDRLPMSPDAWRRIVIPVYERMFGLCHQHGVKTFLHTDGYVVPIIDDLIDAGLDILNPQDLVNGLDVLQRVAKGRVCIDLDIDRQAITPYGTAEEVATHIRRCAETLGSPTGGLTFVWGVYPPTPYENIEAVVRMMHECAEMWAG